MASIYQFNHLSLSSLNNGCRGSVAPGKVNQPTQRKSSWPESLTGSVAGVVKTEEGELGQCIPSLSISLYNFRMYININEILSVSLYIFFMFIMDIRKDCWSLEGDGRWLEDGFLGSLTVNCSVINIDNFNNFPKHSRRRSHTSKMKSCLWVYIYRFISVIG